MPKKGNKRIPDEWLLFARDQAAYIHRSHEIADAIVAEALNELNVTSAKQKKRLFANANHPVRIYLQKLNLLQHLVFLFSERYERRQEVIAPSSITEPDLIVRYLAFIVRKASRRNSLYGVTGICRFIYRYSLSDLRKIHDALVDDPDRLKTDDDFRNYRKKMRDMLIRRFSSYLRIEHMQKGREKHFYLRKDQHNLALWQLIAGSLDAFKPWCTECLPADFNPYEDKQTVFGHYDEHVCELKRLHALIHQDCFKILTVTAKCDEPSSRLGIPQFFFANSSPDNLLLDSSNSQWGLRGGEEGSSLQPTNEALETLRRISLKQDEKLAKFVPKGTISIRVDDREVARLNLAENRQVRLSVSDEDAELIELVDDSEQLVLAAHVLDDEVWQSPTREYRYEVRHSHGPRIVFNLTRVAPGGTVNKHLLIDVTYKRERLAQFCFFLKRRVAGWMSALGLVLAQWVEGSVPFRRRAAFVSIRMPSVILVSFALVVVLVFGIRPLLLNHKSPPSNAAAILLTNSASPVLSKPHYPANLEPHPETKPAVFSKAIRDENQYRAKSRAESNTRAADSSVPAEILATSYQLNKQPTTSSRTKENGCTFQ
jgi:hypothetical protein